MQIFFSRNKYFIFLIPVACIGYWQVAFFQNTLKWDAMDQYYPWRMFVVECFRSGSLPWWNPYEQLGYPIHADPQSGAWYPVVWLFALFGQYTLYSLQIEFMLHIILGGVGIMLLLESFEIKRPFSFLLACAYMLSGFFIGNAQHITYMVSGCWLPFVFYSYKSLAEKLKLKYVVWFSLFCFLLISGGYPAFSIIAFYTFLLAFVFELTKLIKAKDTSSIKKLIAFNAASAILILLMSSAYLISVFSNEEFLFRSVGLSYDIASHGPFSPQALMSLLLPLAAVKNPILMDSDISMSTIYLGVILLISILFSLFTKKNKTEKIIWVACLVFLLASFGNYTPVRKWMFDFLPLMNLFRFPSVFRIFVMIALLLLAGFALSKITDFKKLKSPTGVLLIISMVVSIYFLLSGNANFSIKKIESLSFNNSILMQACIQSVFLLTLFFVFKSLMSAKRKMAFVIAISLADLICAAQLNTPVNVIYSEKTKPVARKIERKYSHEFKIPELHPLKLNNDSLKFIQPLWRNINIFTKQPAWDGYNSFLLNNYLRFVDNKPLRNKIIENNWAYFADTLIFYSDSITAEQISSSPVSTVFVKDDKNISFHANNEPNTSSISVSEFNPQKFSFNVATNRKAVFTLMQQYFPGWEIFIDGNNTSVIVSNYLFMSAMVEKGNHTITFVYKNEKVKMALYISAVMFILCLVFSLATTLKQQK